MEYENCNGSGSSTDSTTSTSSVSTSINNLSSDNINLVDELKVAILLPTAGECLTAIHKALLGCFSQELWTAPVGYGRGEQIRILVRTSFGVSNVSTFVAELH
jgi:hypothetical protein